MIHLTKSLGAEIRDGKLRVYALSSKPILLLASDLEADTPEKLRELADAARPKEDIFG